MGRAARSDGLKYERVGGFMRKAPNRYARPFIPLLFSLMGGIVIGVHWPLSVLHTTAVFIVVACAACLVVCIPRRSPSRFIPLILFVGLGYLSIHPWSAPRFPDYHIVHFTDGPKWRIVGLVHSRPRQQTHRTRFILRVQRLGDRRAAGLLRVTAAGDDVDLGRGDCIELTSRIRSIRNFNNPGAFDYRRYMAFQKVWATAYIPAEKMRVLERAAASGSAGALEEIRNRIEALIDRTRKGPHRGVLRALILGDRSRLSAELRDAFHRSGVGHLLAISGLHIGIIAGSAFFALVAIFSRCEVLLWNAWVKKAAAIGAFVPALLYALIAGMSPSTQRALAMVGMFLLTFLLEREQDSINTLAVAALLILVFQPTALYSVSFQLSFTAVFFILFGLSQIRPATGVPSGSFGRRLVWKLICFFTVTLAATLGTLPLVMTVFQQVSLIAVLTNCVLVPLIGLVVVPLAFLSVLLLWVFPPAATWGMRLAAVLLGLGIEGIERFADLPFAAVDTFVPSLLETVCYYLLLAGGMAMFRPLRQIDVRHAPAWPERTAEAAEPKKRRGLRFFDLRGNSRWIAVVLALAFVSGVADAGYWIYQRFYRSDLRVTVIDVGQGSAALLQLPGGTCALADGGGFADNAVFDVGARVLAPLLRRKKILTVEMLILSHPNSDHLNGLIYIADRFGVKQIWTNGEKHNTVGYQRLQEVLDRRNVRATAYADLPREHRIAGARLELLYPPVGFLEKKKEQAWRDTNANSLVFKVGLGSVSFLFTGDITARAEKELVSVAGSRLNATVLIVPHHGSRTSSSRSFIEAVRPQYGIVSCGWQNRFGFPHPEVLQRYRRQQVRIYQTGCDGAVELVTDGRRLRVSPWIDRRQGRENG
jgi:competence protein ComEC